MHSFLRVFARSHTDPLSLISNIKHLESCCFHRVCHSLFFIVNNTARNVDGAWLELIYNHRRQLHKDICQDIRRHDIIARIADLILNLFVINNIADHYFILIF